MSILALATAILTASGFAVLGDGGTLWVAGSVLYVALTAAGLAAPGTMTLHTATGLTLAGALMLVGGPTPLHVAPLVAGTVAVAELLALAARLTSRTVRHPSSGLGRTAVHTAVGGGVFVLVALVSRVPGPTGLVAVALAAAACAGLAALLVRTVLSEGTRSSILDNEHA